MYPNANAAPYRHQAREERRDGSQAVMGTGRAKNVHGMRFLAGKRSDCRSITDKNVTWRDRHGGPLQAWRTHKRRDGAPQLKMWTHNTTWFLMDIKNSDDDDGDDDGQPELKMYMRKTDRGAFQAIVCAVIGTAKNVHGRRNSIPPRRQ